MKASTEPDGTPQPEKAQPDEAQPDEARAALRTDAERNRERVLAAARSVFCEQGLDVPMTVIARRAGVGIATLYRRFPTREDLIGAVFADRMDAYAEATAEALADPDPWHGFTTYIERVCAMQAADRGFADLLTLTFPTAKALEAKRAEAYEGWLRLIARAKEAGRLRADFSPQDLPVLLMANAGVVTATGDAAPDAWRRQIAYMLQAYTADTAEALPPPPAPSALYRAMIRLGRDTGSRT
ncbi:TetR/AcrR family transcriptional regulator [Streptomyces sp. GQFP]|uniref:TetR/AcrR family transcriptional regulator n=1 Tax=Streptomyces sp. GQFP TaxID=2907545 RepID=UPI001F2F9AF8|nr:TetR/AcrR family transcriptional regulator [Streptomyces sp. GQFP]UIX29225.1 TetR/AcrR family transcriptional regulator [Streptomyces sp. GQFP]